MVCQPSDVYVPTLPPATTNKRARAPTDKDPGLPSYRHRSLAALLSPAIARATCPVQLRKGVLVLLEEAHLLIASLQGQIDWLGCEVKRVDVAQSLVQQLPRTKDLSELQESLETASGDAGREEFHIL
jgi:hypothetical protein